MMYSQILLDHFEYPRNAGELTRADAVVEVTNPVCGDLLKLAVTMKAKKIHEAKFLCRGCTTAIACGSLLTEQLRGREISALKELTAQRLSTELGGIPEASYHAAQLAEEAVTALAVVLEKLDSSPPSPSKSQ
jgi:nitrogen fixation NifU-like protein